MKKRKSWLYAIYSVLAIVGIVAILIFWPKKDETNNTQDDQVEVIEEDTNSNQVDNDEETTSKVYATSLTLNLPSTINLLNGTSVNLLSGYVQVFPNEALESLETEITPRYNSSAFGLELSNSTLTAREVGTYNLTFSVPKSASASISKSVLITIYEEKENAHITQTQTSLIKGVPTSFNEVFSIKDEVNYDIVTDSKINFADDIFSAISTGISDLTISFTENYIKYTYTFQLTIKEQPIYSIVLNNVTNNTIEIEINSSSVSYINYTIQNREEGDVSQALIVEIIDTTIACVEDSNSPLIKIRALEVGTTTLVLTSAVDSSVTTEVTIIVK